MVEYKTRLDAVFGSLADSTRRDILRRVARRELSIGEIAGHYGLTLAAISKHVQVLERARLVRKRRRGKQLFVALSPPALEDASKYLDRYKELWERRLDRLEEYLKHN